MQFLLAPAPAVWPVGGTGHMHLHRIFTDRITSLDRLVTDHREICGRRCAEEMEHDWIALRTRKSAIARPGRIDKSIWIDILRRR